MALRTLLPQDDVRERISSRLQDMSGRERNVISTLGGAAVDVLGLAAPHPMFNLALEAIDRENWIDQVQMTGWRYFVTSNEGVVATAEARSLSRNGPVEGTLTNEGPFVVGSEQALALAEKLPEVAAGQYVLGLLRVPSLYLIALWLRSEVRPEALDRFVPVAPAPEPYQVNSVMEPRAFIDILRSLKRARLASSAGREATTN